MDGGITTFEGFEFSKMTFWIFLTFSSIGINWIVDRLDSINKK